MQTISTVNTLVEQTMSAFNSKVTGISAIDGRSLIDNWISTLTESDEKAEPILDSLHTLKQEIQRGNPDTDQVVHLLHDLASQTTQHVAAADVHNQPGLQAMADSLNGFAQQLNGEAGPAATGGRAAGVSTVGIGALGGGIRPNDGNVSSLLDDDTAPEETNSDEQTGAAGAAEQDGGSYGSGYGTGTPGEDDTEGSSVGGSSSSSGSSDTDTGSSGGRTSGY